VLDDSTCRFLKTKVTRPSAEREEGFLFTLVCVFNFCSVKGGVGGGGSGTGLVFGVPQR